MLSSVSKKPADPATSVDDVDSSLRHHRVISKKKFLKKTYEDFYRNFLKAADGVSSGPWIEIGSGGGFIKEVIPHARTSDIVRIHALTDLTFSALQMPFDDASVGAFFLLNVFHHLHDTPAFLRECERCLRPGGKVIMIEPANTWWSRWIYKNFHHEPFDEKGGWITDGGRLSGGNQALPWIVFVRDRERFAREFPSLSVLRIEPHTPLRYLISGGLHYSFSFPSRLYRPVRWFEKILTPMHSLCGMFMTVVIQKN